MEDSSAIYALISLKSGFDRSMGGFNGTITTSVEKIQNTLFGTLPYAHAFIAKESGLSVGFALYHFRYSSFSGKPSVWLDDIYIIDEARSKGIGAELMAHLMLEAQNHDCSHISWTVSPHNVRGIKFYENLGAIVERMEGTRPFYRLNVMHA